jgi:farnesyl diphosphate synthase
MKLSLSDLSIICHSRLENLLANYSADFPSLPLQKAVFYSLSNGGKRVRPLLVYATGCALSIELEELDAPAAAVELIHSYSLIHDDLPAMDDADLRRGKPSCHKVFGEALAILAGDALQAMAPEIIATHPCKLNPSQRIAMISILSKASGPQGMVGGQALDILEKSASLLDLIKLNQLKTGALLKASVQLAMAAATNISESAKNSLEKYAECLGFAFQIQDYLLDIESDTETLGKPKGIDVINEKITYPSLAGIEATKAKIAELTRQALQAIEFLGPEGNILKELADYLLRRKQ